MKILLKSAVAAGLMLSAASIAVTPAAAQVVKGIGVVNYEAVIANSNAFKTSQQQRETTYKAQFDAAKAKKAQVEAQLKPMVDKFNADSRAASPNVPALQQQAATIQQIEQNGQRDIQNIMQPVALSGAYVEEQINDKIDAAIKAAASKSKVGLILTPDSVLHADESYNLTQQVLNELNALLPSAQLVPPQGWLPRQMREQQAAAAAQQGAAAPAPSAPATNGR
jgi:Skp family chaperone for outer membrane proteins